MISSYTTFETASEMDSIEIACQFSAIFDHYEAVVDSNLAAANEDSYEPYDNLYLVPN